jgi:hypothetical protein
MHSRLKITGVQKWKDEGKQIIKRCACGCGWMPFYASLVERKKMNSNRICAGQSSSVQASLLNNRTSFV